MQCFKLRVLSPQLIGSIDERFFLQNKQIDASKWTVIRGKLSHTNENRLTIDCIQCVGVTLEAIVFVLK